MAVSSGEGEEGEVSFVGLGLDGPATGVEGLFCVPTEPRLGMLIRFLLGGGVSSSDDSS